MAHILKIKDKKTGTWVVIPAIKGEPGKKGEKGDCAKAVGTFSIPVANWKALDGDAIYNYYADDTIAVSPALNDNSIVQFAMDNLMDNNNVGVFSSDGTDTLAVRFYAVTKPTAEVTGKVICFNPSGV